MQPTKRINCGRTNRQGRSKMASVNLRSSPVIHFSRQGIRQIKARPVRASVGCYWRDGRAGALKQGRGQPSARPIFCRSFFRRPRFSHKFRHFPQCAFWIGTFGVPDLGKDSPDGFDAGKFFYVAPGGYSPRTVDCSPLKPPR